ncbi:MAG: class I SAM-dependent methyltransferase [Gammaproteobacteria bacterium]
MYKMNSEMMFLSRWMKSPLSVAAITPSSARLANAMAANLPDGEGLVIELGGGTGKITWALLEAGVSPEHLIVVERDPHFYHYMKQNFPQVRVILGDACELTNLLQELHIKTPARAVVSGLPLLAMDASTQKKIVEQVLSLTRPQGVFIQFSYGLFSPIKNSVQMELAIRPRCVAKVWKNIPPAKVWTYMLECSAVDALEMA